MSTQYVSGYLALPCSCNGHNKWNQYLSQCIPKVDGKIEILFGMALYLLSENSSVCAYWMHKTFAKMSTDNIPVTMIDFS